jgi:hypothetical protein
MYRSTFSWPRHQLEASGQLHAPSALPQGKASPVPIGYEAEWTQEKILAPTGTRTPDSSVVQPVASRYTDCAILALYVK